MCSFSMFCAAMVVAFAAPAVAGGYASGSGSAAGVGGPIPHSHLRVEGPHGPSGLSYGPETIVSPANAGVPNSVGKPPPPSALSGLSGREPTGDWWLRHKPHY